MKIYVKENNRVQRVAKEIKKKVAVILHQKIKDPRIYNTTISDAEISRDLSYLKIFVTFLNVKSPKEIKDGIRILQASEGFIRNLLKKSIYLRIIPKIVFFYDNSIINGERISHLIDQVLVKKEQIQ